jgi:sirohydrochlorin cobaltochelatase
MKSILFVVHGSRFPDKNEKLADLLHQTAEKISMPYEIAYLEGRPETVEAMTEKLIQSGAMELLIVPVLLLPALHSLVEIPQKVKSVSEKFPKVTVKFLKTFGDESAILPILCERVEEAQKLLPQSSVVLLAHGTRHFAENEAMVVMLARQLAEATGVEVQSATYFGSKSYQTVIQENLEKERPQVVLPFFLYNGRLVRKITKQVERLSAGKFVPFTQTLETDARIILALSDVTKKEKTFDTPFTRLT